MYKLDIKIKEQKENECLSACLKAVLNYYKVDVAEEDIIANISKGSYKLYDWEFKAGTYAIKKGLKAELYSNVSPLFDPSWHNYSRKSLLEKMQKSLDYFEERNSNFEKEKDYSNFLCPNKEVAERLVSDAKSVIEFLKTGGDINFKPISKEIIEKIIKSRVPLIVSHNPTLLHRMKRSFNFQADDIRGYSWGHVVIISGYIDNNFIINNPDGMFYKQSLNYEVDKDLMLESMLRYNGQMLVVRR